MGRNDLKLPISVCFTLYFRNCRSYHQGFDNDIYRCFSLFLFKKYNIVNIKIICFLLAHSNSFFNNYLFSKFTNKCQKEILWCDPPCSHVCGFLFNVLLFHYLFQFVQDWSNLVAVPPPRFLRACIYIFLLFAYLL